MYVLTKFGSVYTFPTSQISVVDNFAELVTRTKRLPGAGGGFDELGDQRGLSEVGSIQADFWLHFTGRGDEQTQLEAIRKMADSGVLPLYMRPTDPTLSERWTRARLSSLSSPFNARDVPHKRVRVKLAFQASEPFWNTAGNGAVWGGGWKWGDGTKWGGGSGTTVTGTSTTLTFTNNGNAYTQPTISIRPAAGKSVIDPIIRRIVNGAVVDEVRYAGVLAATQRLFIDCASLKVWLEGSAIYGTQFTFKNASWLRLLPGSNTIKVLFALLTDEAVVRLHYKERYV